MEEVVYLKVAVVVAVLVQIASVHCDVGVFWIKNDLHTDLVIGMYSDNYKPHPQMARSGQTVFLRFDPRTAPFYNVWLLASHEKPRVKAKTIRAWTRGYGFPNDVSPLSQWTAATNGLYYFEPLKRMLFFPWDNQVQG